MIVGSAHYKGFFIEGDGMVIASSGYPKDLAPKVAKKLSQKPVNFTDILYEYCLLLQPFFFLFLGLFLIFRPPLPFLAVIPFLAFCGAEITILWKRGYLRSRPLKQWHGCEHKVINLLESGQKPSLGNLKKASRLHERCSTRYVSPLSMGFLWYNLILQRFLTTCEPTRSQLEEGLRVAKNYYSSK